MKPGSKPFPAWLKWGLRILGGCLILGASAYLALHGLAMWAALKALFAGGPGLKNQTLESLMAGALGQLVGLCLCLLLGLWLIRLPGRKVRKNAGSANAPSDSAPGLSKASHRPAANRWNLCNVLAVGAESHHLWQFDLRSRNFALTRDQTGPAGNSLPSNAVGKSWSSLWQPRLNVAWLPPENVFIRVAQFPLSSPDETRAMVELQLEKLSPIPVTQAVWTMHLLPNSENPSPGADTGLPGMQTVAVTIAPRGAVEEFLGQLEGQGYLADRLEVPHLDQLQATVVRENGAWIYPIAGSGKNALVAWWYHGVLRNLAGLTFPADNDTTGLKDQLMQMAWGGELEGWLTAPPTWHLVADEPTAQQWEPLLRQALDQPLEIGAPLSGSALAALTAKRGAQADLRDNLMPAEFADRYRQKFVDRLWLRGLGGLIALYGIGCVIYFIAVGFVNFQCKGVEKEVKDLTRKHVEALELKARHSVLKERQELKYAALDCWEKTAELLPDGLTLDSMNFSDGRKLTISGSAPAQQVDSIIDFSSRLRKAMKGGQPLFRSEGGDPLQTRVNPGNSTVSWSFGLELRRAEAS